MSSSSQFLGGDRIATSVVNSAAEQAQVSLAVSTANCAQVLSGALTAGTLKEVLSVTGRGKVNFCAAWRVDTTSRAIRLRLTLDGGVIYDATSPAATGSVGQGLIALGGALAAGTLAASFQPMLFNQSFKVEISSSLAETDKLGAGWNYEVHR